VFSFFVSHLLFSLDLLYLTLPYPFARGLLYEDLGVAEYWVVDVKKARVTAFKIIPDGGSQRINQSNVLPGLGISLLEEGLQRSCQMDNTSVSAWFLATVQAS